MSQQKIEIVQDYDKPLAEVFAVLSDHNRLGKVLGVPVKRIRDGENSANGVGSVRRIGVGPLSIEETVTALSPNRSIDYRITKGGGPVRNHHGRIQFSGSGRGSRVNWVIQFDSPVPGVGPLVRAVLNQAIRMGLKRV